MEALAYEPLILELFQRSGVGSHLLTLDDLCYEEKLWQLLSDIDDTYFQLMLYAQFSFSFDTIVRLMVDYAWERCKVSVSSRYSSTLIQQRNPDAVAAFVLFLVVHSEQRQRFVENILEMQAQSQKQLMQIIENQRKRIMENDVAEVLGKVSILQGQLEQETKKVAERDQQISKLNSELQALFQINRDLKKRVSILEEEQQEAMEELNVTNFQDLIHQHKEAKKEQEQAQEAIGHRREQFDQLKQKYAAATRRIVALEEALDEAKQNLQNQSRNRQSLTNVLQDTQDSYIFKEVARLSIKQDSMRMQMMMAKKASQKQKQRAQQKEEQIGQLYRHLKLFQRKVKKIKAERHPQLDSMIRSSRYNI